jgi:histidinol dehydrogenase
VENPQALLSYVRHAGAVFLGHYTPVALGDYALGTNHVLPTGGSARFWSGLSVAEFLRRRTAAFVTKEGFALPAVPSIQLGALEGFGLHAASIKQRFQRDE